MKEEARKQKRKMSEQKTKVQMGTGGQSERVMVEDGRFGNDKREKYGKRKLERWLAVKQRRV